MRREYCAMPLITSVVSLWMLIVPVSKATDHNPSWSDASTCSYGLPNNYVNEFEVGDYRMCRFGNFLSNWLMDNDRAFLNFNHLTTGTPDTTSMDTLHAGGLFVWNGSVRETFQSLNANTWVAPTVNSLGSVYVDNDSHWKTLYRYFTMTDEQLPGIDSSTERYVILVHGWNPNSDTNAYQSSQWVHLFNSLTTWLANIGGTPRWKVLEYHMEADTDTGPLTSNPADDAINGTEAAEIARLHGYHMAKLIIDKCPNVKSVHLIAHSAGSWTARSCLKYLLENSSQVICQMTLLDAYVPAVNNWIQPNSMLDVPAMNDIKNFVGINRIFNLDNYYSCRGDIIGNNGAPGTQESFDWGGLEIAPKNVIVDNFGILSYEGHSGPIQYYADTVDQSHTTYWDGGWRNSIAFNDLTPKITGVSPSKLSALPLPQSQLITITGSGFTSSSRLTFNMGVNSEYADRVPTFVSSTQLTYYIVVGPYAGNWTVRVVNGGLPPSNDYSFTVESSAVLSSLAVSGPATVSEGNNSQFTATATYTDGSSSSVNPSWSVISGPATISSLGVLSASSVSADSSVIVSASFTSGGITKTANQNVTVVNIDGGGGGGGGGGATSLELIRNGNFANNGAYWTLSDNFYADNRWTNPRSSPGYAYLSKSDGYPGNNLLGQLNQTITIPPNCTSAVLSYWYRITTAETAGQFADFMVLRIMDASGINVYDFQILSNLDANDNYEQRTLDLMNFRGQTIVVSFYGYTGNADPTTFRVDDVSVQVEGAPTLSINGPDQVGEGEQAPYTATVSFMDGSTQTITPSWSVSSGASISDGLLTVGALTENQIFTLSASYVCDGVILNAEKTITLVNYTGPLYVSAGNPSAANPYDNWNNAAADIQTAIDADTHNGDVIVGAGTYDKGSKRHSAMVGLPSRVCINRPITVRSVNGPSSTIIKGSCIAGSLNNQNVRCAYVSGGASLIGFTLTDGGTWADSTLADNLYGGGVYGGTWGGGISGVVSNCVIRNSKAISAGGALNCNLYNCIITDNNVTDAGGGAYYCNLYNCTLVDNSAGYGGGAADSGLTACLVSANSAINNGGGALRGTLNSCTLKGNSAKTGGGVYGSTLNNCIVYFNTASSGGVNYDGTPTFSYSCTTPACSGIGNISYDPLFVNAAGSDCRLQSWSPCVDAGENQPWMVGAKDFYGSSRIIGGSVDMGVYEVTTPLSGITITTSSSLPHGETFHPYNATLQATGGAAPYSWSIISGSLPSGLVLSGEGVISGVSGRARVTTFRVKVCSADGLIGAKELSISLTGESVLFVDRKATGTNSGTSWRDAITNLQDAISMSISNDQIWIASGIYKPTASTNRNATFLLKSGVALYGGFSGSETNLFQRDWNKNVAILSGDLLGDDIGFSNNKENTYHVVDGADNTVLDGFAVQGAASAGIFNNDSGLTTILNCTLSSNTGAAVYNNYSSPIIQNCKLLNNNGGGMFNYMSSPIIQNCIFSGNKSSGGGGVYNNRSAAIIENSTFFGNSAGSGDGGGMSVGEGPEPVIINCIFWGNNARRGAEIFINSGQASLTHCDIQEGWSGPKVGTLNSGVVEDGGGNIDDNPLFINPAANNLRLQAVSPCVNTGTNQEWMAADFDLGGLRRIIGSVVDMGAYEHDLDDNASIIKLDGDLYFGAVEAGCSASRTFTISNIGNSPLNVTGITCPKGFAGEFSGNIDPGSSVDVTITFTPTPYTYRGGIVTVNSDRDAGLDSITVSSEGYTPAPSGVLAAWDFYGLASNAVTITAAVYNTITIPVLEKNGFITSGVSNSLAARDFPSGNTLDEAINADKYFSFNLSNAIPVNVTGVSMYIRRSFGSPTNFTLCASPDASFSTYTSVSFRVNAVGFNILSVSNLNISGTALHFRLYGYGMSSETNNHVAGFAGTTNTPINTGFASTSYDLIVYGQEHGFVCITNADNTLSIAGYDGFGAIDIPDAIDGIPVTGIENGAFFGSLTRITVPAGITRIGAGAFTGCSGLISIMVNESNSFYSSTDGVLFNKNKTVLVQYPAGKCGNYTIPDSVGCVGDMAFCYCADLNGVVIPHSVTNIGSYAFTLCENLDSIALSGNAITVGHEAFASCTSLANVVIDSNGATIDDWAFVGCSSLTNVTLGADIVRIEDCAFFDCPALAGIFFRGDAPEVGSDVFYNDNNLTVYRLPETTGWPLVPDLWSGRPTALWQRNADSESIPDSWKQQYFGTTNIDLDAVCSNHIHTIRQAYIAGLNPNDPLSVFKISSAYSEESSKILRWDAVSGRVYSVYWTTNLLSGFQCLESNIPWTQASFTNSVDAPCGYYKIDVRLE